MAETKSIAPCPGHWNETGDEVASLVERYADQKREDLSHGELSDFALANRQFMANRSDLDLIHWQNAAKDRIRWLSVQLALAREPR